MDELLDPVAKIQEAIEIVKPLRYNANYDIDSINLAIGYLMDAQDELVHAEERAR